MAALAAVLEQSEAISALEVGVGELDPVAAFERGRRYEVELRAARARREDFCSAWARAARKLSS